MDQHPFSSTALTPEPFTKIKFKKRRFSITKNIASHSRLFALLKTSITMSTDFSDAEPKAVITHLVRKELELNQPDDISIQSILDFVKDNVNHTQNVTDQGVGAIIQEVCKHKQQNRKLTFLHLKNRLKRQWDRVVTGEIVEQETLTSNPVVVGEEDSDGRTVPISEDERNAGHESVQPNLPNSKVTKLVVLKKRHSETAETSTFDANVDDDNHNSPKALESRQRPRLPRTRAKSKQFSYAETDSLSPVVEESDGSCKNDEDTHEDDEDTGEDHDPFANLEPSLRKCKCLCLSEKKNISEVQLLKRT